MDWNYNLFWAVVLEGSVSVSKTVRFSEGGGAAQCLSCMRSFIHVHPDIYRGCALGIFAYVVAIRHDKSLKTVLKKS